jgi:hypothetical protein
MMFQIFHTFVDLGKTIMATNVTHITLDPLQSLLHLDMGFIIWVATSPILASSMRFVLMKG